MEEKEKTKQETAKAAKIGVSSEADAVLDRMVQKVNNGFSGWRVTKNDLASWVLTYFENHGLNGALEKIRKDHFDQVAYLESVVKELKHARKAGGVTPNVDKLLAPISSQIKTISDRKRRGSE